MITKVWRNKIMYITRKRLRQLINEMVNVKSKPDDIFISGPQGTYSTTKNPTQDFNPRVNQMLGDSYENPDALKQAAELNAALSGTEPNENIVQDYDEYLHPEATAARKAINTLFKEFYDEWIKYYTLRATRIHQVDPNSWGLSNPFLEPVNKISREIRRLSHTYLPKGERLTISQKRKAVKKQAKADYRAGKRA